MKKFILLYLLFFSFSFASTSVHVGIYENPPLSFTDVKTKEEKGLFVDILKDIAKKENLNLNFTPCEFKVCLKLLKDKKIDILGPVAYSSERAKNLLFLDENILSNWGVVYTKNSTHIKNFFDLKNKKIGFLKQDIYTNFFLELAKDFKVKTKIVLFSTYDDIFKAIEDGKIFAGVGGRLLYYSIYEKFSSIKESNIIFKPVDITFALNKQDIKLKKLFDDYLKNYKIDENSKYYKILDQYLTIKTNGAYLKWVISAIIFLILSIAFLLFINNLLNNRVKKVTKNLLDAKNTIKQSLDNQLYLTSIIEMVKEVNQLLIADLGFDERLNSICNTIVKNRLYSFCFISFINENGSISIKAQSAHDLMGEEFKVACEKESIHENILLKKVYETKSTVTYNAEDMKSFPCHIITEEFPFNCFLSTPIFGQKDVKAIISVFGTNKNGFKDKEIELIEELAGDFELWLNLEKLKKDKIESYKQVIYSLNKTVEARDPYTAGHDDRVSQYSKKIAKALKINEEDINTLEKAAQIHDIGKIKIPDSILLKPGPLTKTEYEIVKEHPSAALEMLQGISFLKEELQIILYHHERFDGSGYPYGLKEDEIPLLSQILAVSDTFDAMTTNRIYKKAKSKNKAIEELKNLSGSHFSHKIIDVAILVFNEVGFEKDIYQMPLNALEEARFSYFFKDNTTGCFNKNFLEYLIIENRQPIQEFLFTINLRHFTLYNHKFGWENGDKFLENFSSLLINIFDTDKIFRVKGDDFIILSENGKNITKQDILKDKLFVDNILDLEINKIKISQIKRIEDLKNLIRSI